MDQQDVFSPIKDFTEITPQFCKPTDQVQGADVARSFLGRGIWFGQNADFWIFIHKNIVGLEINAQNTYPTSQILLDKNNHNVVIGMSIKGMLSDRTFKEFCTWCLETYMKIDHTKQKPKLPQRHENGTVLDFSYWIRTNALIAKNEIVEYLTAADPRQLTNCEKLKRALQNLDTLLDYNNKVIHKSEGEY